LIDGTVSADPTVYRLYESLRVYGPMVKTLINEQFGDDYEL
jgi:cyanate lyase